MVTFKGFRRVALSVWSLLLVFAGASMVYAEGGQEQPTYMTIPGHHQDQWKLKATDGLLIGGYGDNFSYDGKRVVPVGGSAMVDVNAGENTGKMEVVFDGTINPEAGKTYSGKIRLVYDSFAEGSDFWEGGVADYIYLHGDTGQEAPVMPRVRTDLASWGPVDVYVDNKLVYENLAGHMMYTEGTRDPETYAIYNKSGNGFFSPMKPADGSIAQPEKKELHFVAHSTDPDEKNFPPHTVWIHLNFQTVTEE